MNKRQRKKAEKKEYERLWSALNFVVTDLGVRITSKDPIFYVAPLAYEAGPTIYAIQYEEEK
jgi:hypothetical protein